MDQEQNNSANEITEQTLRIIKCLLPKTFRDQKSKNDFENNKPILLDKLIYNLNVTGGSIIIPNQMLSHFIHIIRGFMLDNDSKIRQKAIKVIRLVLTSPSVCEILKKHSIYVLFARYLEREIMPDISEENLQILKVIKKWIEIDAKNFPYLLANTLVSLAEDSCDFLKKVIIEDLRKLAIYNPYLAAWSGGIKVLVDSIIDPRIEEMSESLTYTILYLINDPESRKAIQNHLGLTKLFYIFTDVGYSKDARKEFDKIQSDKILKMAKKAILIILKSWTGLIYLGYEKTCISSLIKSLKQPIRQSIRDSIYDIISEILSLGIHNIPKTGYDFQIQNLSNYYLMVFVNLLMEHDFFQILIELSGLEDPKISEKAQKFLKYMSYLNLTLLNIPQKNYPDYLISSTEIIDTSLIELKSRSYEAVHTMGDYIFDSIWENSYQKVSSKLVNMCENLYISTHIGLPRSKLYSETLLKIKAQSEIESDEKKFIQAIELSGVSSDNWNWQIIGQIIDSYLQNKVRFNEFKNTALFKKLSNYFQPSNRKFVLLDWIDSNFLQAKIGYSLLTLIIKHPSAKQILTDKNNVKCFIEEYSEIFQYEATNENKTESDQYYDLLSYKNFNRTMIREYISWIGLLSSHDIGQSLLLSSGIYEILKKLMLTQNKDYIINHILLSFDYRNQENRNFLRECLKNGSEQVKRFSVELLRSLYRLEINDFEEWGFKIITDCFQEDNSEFFFDLLKEICFKKQNAKKILSSAWEQLKQFKCDANELFIHFLMVKDGFNKLNEIGWINDELTRWKHDLNLRYVEKVEKRLYQNLDKSSEYKKSRYTFIEPLSYGPSSKTNYNLIYRLPWSIGLTYEHSGSKIECSPEIECFIKNNKIIFLTKNFKNEDLLSKVYFRKGSSFCLKLSLNIGTTRIDFDCSSNPSRETKFDSNDLSNLKFRNNLEVLEKNGIFVELNLEPEAQIISVKKIKIEMTLEFWKLYDEPLPPHLLGHLCKTKSGINLLRNSNYLNEIYTKLRISKESNMLEVRAALWCVGNMGLSNKGVDLLMEYNLLETVEEITLNSDYLSLRGTGFYVLNLISNTTKGAQILADKWLCFHNGANMKACLPKSINILFIISNDYEEEINSIYWEKFQAEYKKLSYSEIKTKILERISSLTLANTLAIAKNELGAIVKTYKENRDSHNYIGHSNPLADPEFFYSVLMILTFFKFITPIRRWIYNLFEKAIDRFEGLDKIENKEHF